MNHFEKVTPEIDTIRIFWFCEKVIDITAFMGFNSSDVILSVQRLNLPEFSIDSYQPLDFTTKWEKQRLDMRKSWWGKMQIGQGAIKFGKGQDTHEKGLFFEYSVAKWYNVSNGLNSGCSYLHCDFLKPIFESLKKLGIKNYFLKEIDLETHFLTHFQVRRLDLSYNFKTFEPCEISDIIKILSTCRINNHQTELFPDVNGKYNGVSWGGGRGSSYKVMFYDKYLEQKNYFNTKSFDNTLEIFKAKKEFFNLIENDLKNTLRYEIQFKSKFFLDNFKENFKYRRTEEMANEILTFCAEKWQQKLQIIDEQLGALNTLENCGENATIVAQNILEEYRKNGGLSNTVVNNLLFFMQQCREIGWKNVRALYSNQSFSKKYCDLKKITGFDVKRECVDELPIIYNIETIQNYLDKLKSNLYFVRGAYVKQAV